jgi:hypothetical protein
MAGLVGCVSAAEVRYGLCGTRGLDISPYLSPSWIVISGASNRVKSIGINSRVEVMVDSRFVFGGHMHALC